MPEAACIGPCIVWARWPAREPGERDERHLEGSRGHRDLGEAVAADAGGVGQEALAQAQLQEQLLQAAGDLQQRKVPRRQLDPVRRRLLLERKQLVLLLQNTQRARGEA